MPPTLAQMLGGVDFPIVERKETVVMMGIKPPQTLDSKEEMLAEMVDLEKGILMQSSIGK